MLGEFLRSLNAIALATVWNMYCELDQRPDNWIEVEGLEPASKLGFDEGDFDDLERHIRRELWQYRNRLPWTSEDYHVYYLTH
jgi:hypothetical protein